MREALCNDIIPAASAVNRTTQSDVLSNYITLK